MECFAWVVRQCDFPTQLTPIYASQWITRNATTEVKTMSENSNPTIFLFNRYCYHFVQLFFLSFCLVRLLSSSVNRHRTMHFAVIKQKKKKESKLKMKSESRCHRIVDALNFYTWRKSFFFFSFADAFFIRFSAIHSLRASTKVFATKLKWLWCRCYHIIRRVLYIMLLRNRWTSLTLLCW